MEGVRKLMCFASMRVQVCLPVYASASQNECGCVPGYSLCLGMDVSKCVSAVVRPWL